MNSIKENKSLAVIFGIMIAGALGLGFVLFQSYSEYETKKTEWVDTQSSVTRLEGAKLYPSAQNLKEKDAKVTEYAENVTSLRSALLDPTVQQSIKPLTETEFQAKLKERVNVVKKSADAQGIRPPADFALGFSEYTGSLPRSADVAAELGLHLDVSEKLFQALVDSGVKSIEMFERTPLPNEKAPPPVTTPVKKPTATKKPVNNKKKPLITEEAASEPVLDRYTTKIMFTSDQAPLQSVINTLSDPAKMHDFMVVRLLRVENEQQEGPMKSTVSEMARNSKMGSSDSSALPPAAAPGTSQLQVISAPAPLPADAVTIVGNEMLKVYLEVDYIRFRPAADGKEDSPTAKQETAAVGN